MQVVSAFVVTLIVLFAINCTEAASVRSSKSSAVNAANKEGDTWSDLVSEAVKLIGKAVDRMNNNTEALVRNDTDILLKNDVLVINETLKKLGENSETASAFMQRTTRDIEDLYVKTQDTDQKIATDIRPMMANVRADINSYSQNINNLHSEVVGMRSSLVTQIQSLESNLNATDKRWEDRFTQMDKRFSETDKRWEDRLTQMDKRWEDRLTQMDKRFSEADKRSEDRFTQIDKRLDNLYSLIEPLIHPTTTPRPRGNEIRMRN